MCRWDLFFYAKSRGIGNQGDDLVGGFPMLLVPLCVVFSFFLGGDGEDGILIGNSTPAKQFRKLGIFRESREQILHGLLRKGPCFFEMASKKR